MIRKIIRLTIIVALGLIVSGCGLVKEFIMPSRNSTELQPKATPAAQQGQNSTDTKNGSGNQANDKTIEQIRKMTLDEKIGQMIISGVDGFVNDSHSKEMIEKYHVGGFILLGKNVKSTEQVLNLLNSLKETNIKSGNKTPLFLSIDQEGGRIDRMPSDFSRLPTSKAIGKTDNSQYSYSIGEILGEEIKSLGYNMNFAPVMDINNNPKNQVIGDRSFGTSSDIVTKLGIETMKGIRSKNVISVVKHFPGHGDTSVDSHSGLPIINVDLERLKSFELIPFAEAIKNDVDMVMVAHILFPKIDPQYPASLSKKIITDLLRKDLGYKGIVITDDMTMGAIVKKYNIGEAAVASVNAGTDIILVCHDFDKEVSVINALKTAVQKGIIPEKNIDGSVYRILKLKEKYNISDNEIKSVDVNRINNMIQSTVTRFTK